MLPIYTVEKPGFKQLLTKFDSRYQLPSRSYFSRTAIPGLYTQIRNRLHTELKHVKFYSATTDLWSSVTMESYVSFTIDLFILFRGMRTRLRDVIINRDVSIRSMILA